MQKKKIVNVTHNDLDGAGCPVVLRTIFPENEIVPIYCGYHDVEEKLSALLDDVESNLDAYEMIFITDISFRQESKLDERISRINEKVKKYNNFCWFITLLDHHATATWLNKYLWALVSETDELGKKQCGTAKLFIYLFRTLTSIPTDDRIHLFYSGLNVFVDLVNKWDTWRWVEDYPPGRPDTQASDLNKLFGIYGRSKFVDEFSSRLIDNLHGKFIYTSYDLFNSDDEVVLECKANEVTKDVETKDNELEVINLKYDNSSKYRLSFVERYLQLQHIEKEYDYLLDSSFITTFKVGVVFLTRNISEVGNKLSELHPELDFIMIINFSSNVPRFSFRTTKDNLKVPLGIVADFVTGKGGGHPKSAGGTMKLKDALSLLNKIL